MKDSLVRRGTVVGDVGADVVAQQRNLANGFLGAQHPSGAKRLLRVRRMRLSFDRI